MCGGREGGVGGGVLQDRWLGKSPGSSKGAVSLNSELRMRHTGAEPLQECPLHSADTVHFMQHQSAGPAAFCGYEIKLHYIVEHLRL